MLRIRTTSWTKNASSTLFCVAILNLWVYSLTLDKVVYKKTLCLQFQIDWNATHAWITLHTMLHLVIFQLPWNHETKVQFVFHLEFHKKIPVFLNFGTVKTEVWNCQLIRFEGKHWNMEQTGSDSRMNGFCPELIPDDSQSVKMPYMELWCVLPRNYRYKKLEIYLDRYLKKYKKPPSAN